jgi:hypothetical protein
MNAKTLLILAFLTTSFTGCGSSARKKIEASDNLKQLSIAIIKYHDERNAWPDTLEQVKPMIGQQYMGTTIGNGKDYADLLKNPFTGDNPGYEYEKPSDGHAVVLYQMRGGKRDLSLPIAHADGSVRENGSNR